GIGSGHRESTPQRVRPLDAMARYLDVLDEHAVPQPARVLSGLGPRMLELAAARSAGTHPYLTVPSQSGEARTILGPNALVAPEQTVGSATHPDSPRRIPRNFRRRYLKRASYRTTMLRGGFSVTDVEREGSDNLVDRLVAHGDARARGAAVGAH